MMTVSIDKQHSNRPGADQFDLEFGRKIASSRTPDLALGTDAVICFAGLCA